MEVLPAIVMTREEGFWFCQIHQVRSIMAKKKVVSNDWTERVLFLTLTVMEVESGIAAN
jgi:hypothetical protein